MINQFKIKNNIPKIFPIQRNRINKKVLIKLYKTNKLCHSEK